MRPKDEFIALQKKQDGKITFAVNEYGHITHIVKRVDPRLYDVFSRLQKIRCVNLPIILDLVKRDACLEVHEEYVRGRTVEQARQEKGTLDDSELLSIATDVCRALAAIHGTAPPIVHRDIKPENIMERENGGYVLIDFDAARIYREDAQTDTQCIATVGYAAPEQYGLSQTDARSDLFSLGVTLYELKTGESYHVDAKCGGLLKRIIAKCTAFEPKKRFQSAQQLMKRLEALEPGKKRRLDKARVCVAASTCVTALAVFCAVYSGTAGNRLYETPEQDASSDGVVKPSAAVSAQCTCEFTDAALTTDKGLFIPFEGTPVTAFLKADGEFYRENCAAAGHSDTVELTACRIDESTLGASAEITDNGTITVKAAGAYYISGFVKVGGEVGDYIKAVLIATDKPEAYTRCKCVLDVGPDASALALDIDGGFAALPNDGSILYVQMYLRSHYIDRLCSATEHLELMPMQGYVEDAPAGANCGVTADNRFYTDAEGIYQLLLPAFYRDEIIRFGCLLEVRRQN